MLALGSVCALPRYQVRAPRTGKNQAARTSNSTTPTITIVQFRFCRLTGNDVGMTHSTCA